MKDEQLTFNGEQLRRGQLLRVAASTTLHLSLIALLCLAGCETRAVYVATDRRIESVTNSLGLACKAVPDAVFAEMLVKIQRLRDLEKKAEVDARLTVPKN